GWSDSLFKGWDTIIDAHLSRPTIQHAFGAYIAGLIDDKKFKTLLLRNGANIGDWKWLIPLFSNRLSPEQITEAWKRGIIGEGQFDNYMKLLQYGIRGDLNIYKNITAIIPSPGEMVRMISSGLFDPQLVRDLQLDAELDKYPD